jgi:hypothetical protein
MHQSKIGGYNFRDGVMLYAMAGHPEMAEAAIQQCEEPLADYTGKPRSCRQIADIVRKVLSKEHRKHITNSGREDTEDDYNFVVAIQSDIDGVGLYCTYKSQMRKSRLGIEIIGMGEPIGRMAVTHYGRILKQTPGGSAAIAAAYAIAEAKRHQQSTVGGGSVIPSGVGQNRPMKVG